MEAWLVCRLAPQPTLRASLPSTPLQPQPYPALPVATSRAQKKKEAENSVRP